MINLKRKVIKNTEPYQYCLFSTNDLASKAYSTIAGKANKNDVFYNSGSINMSGDLNMGGKEIKNIKPFVENGNISRSMTDDLNMGDYEIVNIKPFVEYDKINQAGEATDFRLSMHKELVN